MIRDPLTHYCALRVANADDDTIASELQMPPGIVRAWREKPPPEGRQEELAERMAWWVEVGQFRRPRLATSLIGLPHPLEVRPDAAVEADPQPPDVSALMRPMPRRQQYLCRLVALELAAAVVLGESAESVAGDLFEVLRGMDAFLRSDDADLLRNPEEPLSWSAGLAALDLIRPDHRPPPASWLRPLIQYWIEDARSGAVFSHGSDELIEPAAELASQRQLGRQRVPQTLFLRRWWARCRQRLAFRRADCTLLEPLSGLVVSSLDDERVPMPCPIDVREMGAASDDPDRRVRSCTRCGRRVFMTIGLTPPEIDALLADQLGYVCGWVFRRLDGGLMLEECGHPVRVQTRLIHYL